MSDTPRTDSASLNYHGPVVTGLGVSIKFAREMELELAEANRRISDGANRISRLELALIHAMDTEDYDPEACELCAEAKALTDPIFAARIAEATK